MLSDNDFNPISKLLTNEPRLRHISFKEFSDFYGNLGETKKNILKIFKSYSNELQKENICPTHFLLDGEFTMHNPNTRMLDFLLLFDLKNIPPPSVLYQFWNVRGKIMSKYRKALASDGYIPLNPTLDLEKEIFKNDKAELLQLGNRRSSLYAKAGLLLIDFKEVV